MVTPHLPWKFHANRSSRFLVMLLTKKQRKKERKKLRETNTPSPCGVTIKQFKKWPMIKQLQQWIMHNIIFFLSSHTKINQVLHNKTAKQLITHSTETGRHHDAIQHNTDATLTHTNTCLRSMENQHIKQQSNYIADFIHTYICKHTYASSLYSQVSAQSIRSCAKLCSSTT